MEAVFRIEAMSSDVTDIKQAMREMASAVNKLAVVEERQMHDRLDLSRIFGVLEGHESRLKVLEIAQPGNKQTGDWVNKAVWLVVGGAMSALLSVAMVMPRDAGRATQNTTTTTTNPETSKR